MKFIDTSPNLIERKSALINAFITADKKVEVDVFDFVCDEIKALRNDLQALSKHYVTSVHNPNVKVRLYSENLDDRCVDVKLNKPIKPYKWVANVFFIAPNEKDEIPFARFMVEAALGFKLDKNLQIPDPDLTANLQLIRIRNFKKHKHIRLIDNTYAGIAFKKTHIVTGEVVKYNCMIESELTNSDIIRNEQTVDNWHYEIDYAQVNLDTLVKFQRFYFDENNNIYILINRKFVKIVPEKFQMLKYGYIKEKETRIPIKRVYKQKRILQNETYNEHISVLKDSIFRKCNVDVYKYFDPITNFTYYGTENDLSTSFKVRRGKLDLFIKSINTFNKELLEQEDKEKALID